LQDFVPILIVEIGAVGGIDRAAVLKTEAATEARARAKKAK